MPRLTFIALFFCALVSAAQAADFAGEFTFDRGGYSQEADITKSADGSYKVEAYVGKRSGCSGAFDGTGRLEGADLVARKADDETCRLTITRTRNGIRIIENNCGPWHGASCDFNGTLARKR